MRAIYSDQGPCNQDVPYYKVIFQGYTPLGFVYLELITTWAVLGLHDASSCCSASVCIFHSNHICICLYSPTMKGNRWLGTGAVQNGSFDEGNIAMGVKWQDSGAPHSTNDLQCWAKPIALSGFFSSGYGYLMAYFDKILKLTLTKCPSQR